MEKSFLFTCLFAVCGLFLTVNADAQDSPAASPMCKMSQMVGLTEVSLEYSRPGVKGRTIFAASDDALQPFGKAWRVGANSATKMTFSTDFKLNGKDMKAGSYSITAVPGAEEWKINIFKYDGSGAGSYLRNDSPLASFMVKPNELANPFETFIIAVNNITDTTASIDIAWEKTYLAIPLEVPKTW